MTSDEVLKKINKTRRYRLASYVSAHSKYEYYNLHGLYGKLTPSKDKYGQIVLAVKTTDPETIFTAESTTWRIVVDDVIRDDGSYKKATDKKHFYSHKCPLFWLKAVCKAAFPENEQEAQETKATDAPEKPFAGWKGGRPKLSFSADEQEKILSMREKGATIAEIAKELHVGIRRVLRFLHGKESK